MRGESFRGVHRNRRADGVGHLGHDEDAARRRPGHFGCPGHRLDRVDRPQPRSHRGSDHLPDRHGSHLDPARQSGPRLHRFRHFVRLRHLRGRHRHVLGAEPRRRVPAGDSRTTAGGGQPCHRSGCDRCGLDLRVRAPGRKRSAHPRGAPQLPGLASPLPARSRAWRRRGRKHRRLRQAVPGEPRSEQAGRLQRRRQRRRQRHQDEQQRRRRAAPGVFRARVHGSWSRLFDLYRRPREGVVGRRPAWHADSCAGRCAGPAGTGHPARRCGPRWQRRSRRRHRRDAFWRERLECHRAREGEAERGSAVDACGYESRTDLRSIRAHRSIDHHVAPNAHRRGDRRLDRHHHLPVPLPLGADSNSGAADCRARVVHPDALPRRDVEHHVIGRVGAGHRRARRRIDRDGGKRLPTRVGRRAYAGRTDSV